MRRSITALICGLIGSIFSLFWGFTFGVFGNMLGIIPTAEAQNIGTTLAVLGWIAFLGAIVGIVGASLSVKQARRGAITLTIAAIACGILQMYLFVKTCASPSLSVMTSIIIFLLPTVLLIVAAVFDWVAKDKEIGKAYAQPQNNTQAKSLEQEISELKDMLDKGLITEEEFAETKKNLLAKHSK